MIGGLKRRAAIVEVPMTNRTISWLGLIPMLLWLAPLQAKKASPELFGGPLFQWAAAVVNAVLIPLLVLLALKLLTTQDRKKAGLNLLVAAALPLFANFTMLGVGSPIMARTQAHLVGPAPNEKAAISNLLDRAITNDETADRQIAAGLAYQFWGIKAVWRNHADELVRFTPGPEDEAAWARTRETEQMASTTWEVLDGQLRQMPWLFAMNLGSFVIITGAGLLWHVYQKPRAEPAAGAE